MDPMGYIIGFEICIWTIYDSWDDPLSIVPLVILQTFPSSALTKGQQGPQTRVGLSSNHHHRDSQLLGMYVCVYLILYHYIKQTNEGINK